MGVLGGHQATSSDLVFQNIQTYLTATTPEESIRKYLIELELDGVLIPPQHDVQIQEAQRARDMLAGARTIQFVKAVLLHIFVYMMCNFDS